MHKVQADYLMWRNEYDWIVRLKNTSSFIHIMGDHTLNVMSNAALENDLRTHEVIDNLLKWASEKCVAIRIGFVTLKEFREKNPNPTREQMVDFETSRAILCGMALAIPVVTRGETD